MVEARDAILRAIGHATSNVWNEEAAANPTVVRRNYRRKGRLESTGLIDLLEDRLMDYKASVTRCLDSELPGVVARRLSQLGEGVVVVPRGLPGAWLQEIPDGHPVVRREQDPEPLETSELATARGAVSG